METAKSVNELIEGMCEPIKKMALGIANDSEIIFDYDDFCSEALYFLTTNANRYFNQVEKIEYTLLKRYIKVSVRRDLLNLIEYKGVRLTVPITDTLEKEYPKDILSDILDCCLNPQEERVVELRSKGYTMAEVSKKMGVSLGWLSKTVNQIEIRYEGVLG